MFNEAAHYMIVSSAMAYRRCVRVVCLVVAAITAGLLLSGLYGIAAVTACGCMVSGLALYDANRDVERAVALRMLDTLDDVE